MPDNSLERSRDATLRSALLAEGDMPSALARKRADAASMHLSSRGAVGRRAMIWRCFMDPKAHWDTVYRQKRPDEVSWFQREATLSLNLIQGVTNTSAAVLDVGGGASTLVDGLLRVGYRHPIVMDLSLAALQQAQRRLGPAAADAVWLEGDVLSSPIAPSSVDLWHDRAVFHFLTAATDREGYVAQVRQAVRSGGLVLVATFAEDGPTRCSGLEVARYSASRLHGEFGRDFRLLTSRHEDHHTPSGARQSFTYCLCRYEPAAAERPASLHGFEADPAARRSALFKAASAAALLQTDPFARRAGSASSSRDATLRSALELLAEGDMPSALARKRADAASMHLRSRVWDG